MKKFESKNFVIYFDGKYFNVYVKDRMYFDDERWMATCLSKDEVSKLKEFMSNLERD